MAGDTESPAPNTTQEFVHERVQEGEFRKGTNVAPEARLPEGFELPSAAPIVENPSVEVQAPQPQSTQAGDGDA